MIDDDKALVERLRSGKWLGETTCGPAADRIEAQAERVKAMEEALERIAEHQMSDQSYAIECTLLDCIKTARDTLATIRETNDA